MFSDTGFELGWWCVEPGVGLSDVGSFQLGIFCGSMRFYYWVWYYAVWSITSVHVGRLDQRGHCPKEVLGGFGEHVEAAPLQFSNSQNAAVVILAPVNNAAGSSSWGAHGAAQSELAEGSSCQKVTWPYRQSLVALLQQNQKPSADKRLFWKGWPHVLTEHPGCWEQLQGAALSSLGLKLMENGQNYLKTF